MDEPIGVFGGKVTGTIVRFASNEADWFAERYLRHAFFAVRAQRPFSIPQGMTISVGIDKLRPHITASLFERARLVETSVDEVLDSLARGLELNEPFGMPGACLVEDAFLLHMLATHEVPTDLRWFASQLPAERMQWLRRAALLLELPIHRIVKGLAICFQARLPNIVD